jgi:lipid A ethanolaminephosphotransferase
MSASVISPHRSPRTAPLRLHGESLLLLACVHQALFLNTPFWHAVLAGRAGGDARTWLYAAAVFVFLSGLHFALLALFIHRRIARPALVLLFATSAVAAYFMNAHGIYLDPDMLRNVLQTDYAEARELAGPALLGYLALHAALPALLLTRVELIASPWPRALLRRIASIVLALAASAGALLLVFQDFSSLMRNHKEIRYLATPGNYLYSTAVAASGEARHHTGPRQPVALDATLGPRGRQRHKPVLLVIVAGETARAANWGLSGYARQTTPQLAAREVINFSHVTSCGTSTAVSIPCMFSPYGRAGYDEARIARSESLLQVLARAGYAVHWVENQSGCKGVCDGIDTRAIANNRDPQHCDGERCLDEVLMDELDAIVRAGEPVNRVVVLHALGNHGPAYFRRHPASERHYTPTCDTAELRQCSREQIVNSYDNALRYTDAVLARTIDLLKTWHQRYDTALVYASDHGESLGENGLYLHGMPWAIAPREQTEVPMVMWLSDGFTRTAALDRDCLRQRALAPASHDHLFHSVLGLLDVRTAIHDATLDVSAACRASS